MSDYSELKQDAQDQINGHEITCDPETVLALIAENERLKTSRSITERDLAQELEVRRHGPSCWSFGDTGDVHDMVGEWLGQCDCNAAKLIDVGSERDQLKAEVAGLRTGYQAYERVNAELKAEVDRLTTENSDIESAAITYIEDMHEAQHENERLKAEVDSLTREADRQYTTIEAYRKDAERFQWLLKNASVILDKKTAYQAETGFIKFDTMPGRTETELAIDAAMGKGEQS